MFHKPFSRAGIAWEVNRKLDRVEVNDDGTTRNRGIFCYRINSMGDDVCNKLIDHEE